MRKGGLIAALGTALICAGASVVAAGPTNDYLPGGLAWGDDVAAIKGRIGLVEPDLCKADESSYYRSMGWSCEGMSKAGFSAGGAAFNVRLRMSELGYRLVNVNMVAKVNGQRGSAALRQSLATVCKATAEALMSRFGEGNKTSDVSHGEVFRRVQTWTTPNRRSEVTLACMESQDEAGGGEVMVDFEPARARVGLV